MKHPPRRFARAPRHESACTSPRLGRDPHGAASAGPELRARATREAPEPGTRRKKPEMNAQRTPRKGLGGAIKQRRQTKVREDRGELGADTDFSAIDNVDELVAHAARWTVARAADDVRDRERSALVSYFRDIASIPTLTKEHEVLLAKEIEA